ncbi:hypothetical protein BDA96_04G310400 [Sorghum bicolor]|uniref:Major facilitator superfamily (MFS) profile domain-containing protein n=1 Tax=Sorghum bicolor TaxID=4558 RepID=A0A921UJV5_SORBI|nr:hypothetical protein BDA96_04G310400 [Sorghum bicolor]
MHRAKPPGIHLFECAQGSSLSLRTCQALVLILTFFSYASYHAARKTMSVVKGVLDPKTSNLGFLHCVRCLDVDKLYSTENYVVLYGGWAPFDSRDGTALLGDIDLAFLAIYAIGMFFVGHIGDRVDLRVLLTIGMIGTGFFTAAFGAGYWLNIHTFYYFLGIQLIAGLFQSTGWPSVEICASFPLRMNKIKVSGSLISAALLKFGWGWSFVISGAVIALVGLIVFLFLPASPESIGAEDDHFEDSGKNETGAPLLEGQTKVTEKAVGFIEAFRIPGVVTFALCLFFCKLVAYTFLYWLPFYISHTAVGGEYLADLTAGILSTLFDLGGILAGHISDHLDARALTATSFTFSGILALFLYRLYGSVSLYWNITRMFITSMLVNGPYALITTAVFADLGTHSSLRGNSRWTAVFTMLMVAALIAGLLLSRLVMAEVSAKLESWRSAALNDLLVSSVEGA